MIHSLPVIKKKASKPRTPSKHKSSKARPKTKTTHNNENLDENGKFKKGNKAGEGKQTPAATHKRNLLTAFNAAITEKDILEVAKALMEEAKAGNVKAITELFNRCLGKPLQPLEVGGAGGGPISVSIVNFAGASRK